MMDSRLILKSDNRILIVHQNEIDWLEARGNYVQIHCKSETLLIRSQIYQLEEELDSRNFFRISRSVIVNLDFVREMKPWVRGTYRILLRDGTELSLSRNYRERLYSMISKPIGIRSVARAK
jgi:two-component system, LytTR family, response regulator